LRRLKVFAAHELINEKFKLGGDAVSLAFGLAFDRAIANLNYYEYRTGGLGRRLVWKALRHFTWEFSRLAPEGVEVRQYAAKAWRMICAFRKTPAYGVLRDKTRAVVVDGEVAMYAQPDFADDFENVIYEVKSYELDGVWLEASRYQVRLFQLAYPDHAACLIGFKCAPQGGVEPQILRLEPLSDLPREEVCRLLREVLDFGRNSVREEELADIEEDRTVIFYDPGGSYRVKPRWVPAAECEGEFEDLNGQ